MKRPFLWRVSVVTTPEAEVAVAELLGASLRQPVATAFNPQTNASTVTAYLPPEFINPGAPASTSVTQGGTTEDGSRRHGRNSPARRQRSQEQARGFKTRKLFQEITAGLKRIKQCGLKTGPGRVTIVKLRRENWAESWKRHFKPIEIEVAYRRGDFRKTPISSGKSGWRGTPPFKVRSLLIKPSWSKRHPRENQAVVVLDPGLSFGTGQHPTTAFCLRELVRCGKNGAGRSFLDMGTGSGILAIAAAKLGYAPIHAFDLDSEAVRVARANARTNGVHQKLRIARGDLAKLPIRPARQYDLICANLISTLLIVEKQRIINRLRPDGTLVLAGILKPEFPRVRKIFAKLGLKLAVTNTRNEWRSGSFVFARKKSGEV